MHSCPFLRIEKDTLPQFREADEKEWAAKGFSQRPGNVRVDSFSDHPRCDKKPLIERTPPC